MLLGIILLCFITFSESYAMTDNKENQSKIIVVTISYANDTSKTHTILVNNNQKYTVSQEYSRIKDNFTRFNLQAYSIDNGQLNTIQRMPDGNFTLDIFTDSNHSITLLAKPQFKIIISGINKVNFFPPSPTHDNWFDANSYVQINIPYIIQSGQENTRKQLSGWSLDNSDVNIISRKEVGYYTSPVIHMSSTHKIDLEYITQYYIKVISNFGLALGTGWYDSGTMAYVSVISNNNNDIFIKHIFAGWQGAVIGSQNQESVEVLSDSPKVIIANWFVDYTNVSIITIIAIAVLVLSVIYQKRRMPQKQDL
jgi:hypothetical protein